MTEIKYTDPELVTSVMTRTPGTPEYRTYGPKLRSRYMVHYLGRWRRVYIMQYGNAGSLYITVKGEDLFLDTDTEYRLYDLSQYVD